MPIIAAPPATTAPTVPMSDATAPDSNAPSSLEAPMKTRSTAPTRPRSAGAVSSGASVPRIDIDWIENAAENGGPRGSKGVGEPPSVPTAGAIANAIAKVVGGRVRELPLTPERVWAARP